MKKKQSRLLLFIFVFLLGGTLNAQMKYVDTAWVEESPVVGTGMYFHTSTIVVSGNLVVTGNILNGNGDTDIYTYRLDSNGDTLWSSIFSGDFTGGGDDYGIELLTTSGGDIVVTGAVKTNAGGYDYAVLWYDGSTGSLDWSYIWDGNGGTDIPSVIKQSSNEIYVGGGSEATNGFSDFGLIRVSSAGNLVWESFFNHSSLHDAISGLSFISSYVMAVGATAVNVGDWDMTAVLFNKSTGAQFSTNTVDIAGATMVEANAMVMDSMNNIYITGYAEVTGDKHIQTIKLDSALALKWIANHSETGLDNVGRDIAVDNNGSVFVTGYSEESAGKYKSILIKYADTGDTLVTEFFGNTETMLGAKGEKMVIDSVGNVLLTGTTEDRDSMQQMFFNKYSNDCELLLSAEYSSYGINDRAYDIATEGKNVYITGLSTSLSGPRMTVLNYDLLQDVNPSYFYLGGKKSFWCQQPGMYSFGLTDSTELTGYVDSTIVIAMQYFPVEGIHYVFFSPEATQTEVDSVINLIESEADFDKEYLVATLTRHNNISYAEKKYAGATNHIEVVFDDPEIDILDVENFADTYEIELVFSPDVIRAGSVFVFKIPDSHHIFYYGSPDVTFQLATEIWLNDSAIVDKVTPSLRMFRPDTPDDPLYSSMWWAKDNVPMYCNETEVYPVSIDLDCAWNFENEFGTGEYYSGEGIVVAVIDFDGVEFSHPDCNGMYTNLGYVTPAVASPSIVVGFNNDFYFSTGSFKAHGQNVCGIIGARIDNNEGAIGVAHNAKIMPFLMQGTTDQFSSLLEKILEQTGPNEIDAINMSFAYNGMSLAEAIGFPFYNALFNCYESGRPDPSGMEDSRGISLITGTGNAGQNIAQIPAAIPFVFSVGATTPWDYAKVPGDDFDPAPPNTSWGSNYFEYMDVAAPGICIYSTDFTDSNPNFPSYGGSGYTTGNYHLFSGTSAATPIVTGIVALILEKDSMLTVDEAYEIIRYSCEKVGGYTYSNPNPDGKCQEIGFGRVNACLALQNVEVLSNTVIDVSNFSVIHANPVGDRLDLLINGTSNYAVEFYTITGQLIYTSDVQSSTNCQIDVSDMANGMYFLNVINLDDNTNYTAKIVIQ